MEISTATRQQTSLQEGDPWARTLADRLTTGIVPAETDQCTLEVAGQAADALWALFDQARTQANDALARTAAPVRIGVEAGVYDRQYMLVGSNRADRVLSVFLAPASPDGHTCGEATIHGSQSRAGIHVTPVRDGTCVRWQAAHSGAPLTEETIHTLFLSEFGDDPIATLHLSPLAGTDLYETPWG